MKLPRSILVTGGAGFIGNAVVRLLQKEDDRVHVVNLDLLTYAGSRENLDDLPDPGRHTFVHGDIADAPLVAELLAAHAIDAVVNLAAESHVDRSIDDAADFVKTNIVGTHVLLEAALRHWKPGQGRFVQVSTDEVYGSLGPGDGPFTESSPYAPNSPYAASKAAADHLVRAYGRTHDLPVVTTHGSNTYGPRQHDEKFIPTLLRAGLRGDPMPIYGDGTQVREWIHVEDHAGGIIACLRSGQPGESYNLGSARELDNLLLARQVCRILDELEPGDRAREELLELVEDRPGHDWRYALDCQKAREELGWSPAADWESALRGTIAAYLDSPSWRRRTTEDDDVEERRGLRRGPGDG